ncbi:EutN/CcmL family microcompartment protein [bacterium]|nr:EutN/CcmL family microcompartment protein [bacterium]
MIFAKVIGTVVSTQKDPKLTGKKLLLCKQVDHNGKPLQSYHVAVDAVQAGEGDFVLLTYGSAARMTDLTKDAPIDAVIMAVIDEVTIDRNPAAVSTQKKQEKPE